MVVYGRSDIHAAKIMTLEIRTGNHSNIWSFIAENADTMTWWTRRSLKSILVGD
jgi:hypothetical protein